MGNALQIPKGNVQERHARVVPGPEGWVFVELRSTNGSWVNGEQVSGSRVLRDGDRIYVRDAIFDVRVEDPSKA